MATFLIKSIDGDLPMYSCSNRDKAVKQAERFRKANTPCCILKLFSKAGHPHIARIEYDSNLRGWAERESINCDQYERNSVKSCSMFNNVG